jgi:hypothetical protein
VGEKATKAEVRRRVDEVCDLLLGRIGYAHIVRYSSVNWGVGERQAEKYIARATALIRTVAEGRDRLLDLGLAIADYDMIFAKQMAAHDLGAGGARTTLDKIVALLGLEAPLKVEHSGSVGVDLSRLSDEELADLERLYRKIDGLDPEP